MVKRISKLRLIAAGFFFTSMGRASDLSNKSVADIKKEWQQDVPQLIQNLETQKSTYQEKARITAQLKAVFKDVSMRRPEYEKSLIKAVKGRDVDSKRLAIEALVLFRTTSANDAIASVFRDRSNPGLIRGVAVTRYAEGVQGGQSILVPQVKNDLQAFLNDSDSFVAIRTARTLAHFGEKSGEQLAIKIATQPNSPVDHLLTSEAIRTLGEIGDLNAKGILKPYLQGSDAYLKGEAIIASKEIDLHNLADAKARLTFLGNTLSDTAWGPHRGWALAQLHEIAQHGTPSEAGIAIQILKDAASDISHPHRRYVQEILADHCDIGKQAEYCP